MSPQVHCLSFSQTGQRARQVFNALIHVSTKKDPILGQFRCPNRRHGICLQRACPFSHNPTGCTSLPSYVCIEHLRNQCTNPQEGACGLHLTSEQLADLPAFEAGNQTKLALFYGPQEWSFTCDICTDQVLLKQPPEHRTFAYLENCREHVFCGQCLLRWRSKSASLTQDQCPLCRTVSRRVVTRARLVAESEREALFPPQSKLILALTEASIYMRRFARGARRFIHYLGGYTAIAPEMQRAPANVG